ncbi:MAG: helix-turn-helix domain-containing protein [Chloroflexota bacterium]|nr:helix-turn-helix domain-containing protein [Chloroflexota bacterium]
MHIAYPQVISENVEELRADEQRLRGTTAAPRVQMLRLLKSGEATNVPQVATLVGYSPRQIQRWWQTYRTAGLVTLIRVYHPAGKPAQLTEEAWAGLQGELEAGRIGGQEEARRYLAERWGVQYQSIHGISYQCKRRKVKWKTGRRRHVKADAAAQAAFKQTSPPR